MYRYAYTSAMRGLQRVTYAPPPRACHKRPCRVGALGSQRVARPKVHRPCAGLRIPLTMSSTETGDADVSLTVKGPNALKLTVHVSLDMTVLQLKQKIEEADKNFPVAR